jgi:hypothetical protein
LASLFCGFLPKYSGKKWGIEMNEYYKNHKLILPKFAKFRQYKYLVDYCNGCKRMIKVKKIIRNEKHLRQILVNDKRKVIALYVSLACFLQPHKVTKKKRKDAHFKTAENCFMFMDYGIDLDKKDTQMLKKILIHLKLKGFKDIEVFETGNGFHIWVHDFKGVYAKKSIENSKQRENYFHQKLVELTHYLKRNKCKFDFQQSINTRQVFRVPNSLYNDGKTRIKPYNYAYLFNASDPRGNDVTPIALKGMLNKSSLLTALAR